MKEIDWKTKYNRILSKKNFILNNLTNDNYLENALISDFETFCSECFHFFEWIDIVQETGSARAFAKNNKYIVICGGIANHTKHVKVYRYKNDLYSQTQAYRYATQNIVESSTGFSGNIDDAPAILHGINDNTSKLIIAVDDLKYNVFDFLENCIGAWNEYLQNNDLL